MKLTAKRIYCFIENYDSQITHTLSLTISLCLIRFYFKNTASENFDQLSKKEENKLKESNRRISRALKLSTSKVATLRGGASYPINPKLIATQVATITVNAAKDGSIHALAIIIACKLHPQCEKFVKAICFGGNTDAIINEMAKNLESKRRTIIIRLMTNEEIRKNINNILLELELIKEPLTRVELFRLFVYGVTAFEVPLIKGVIIGARGIALMFITNKIRRVILSELSGEIAKGIIVAIMGAVSNGEAENLCGIIDMTDIERLKQGLLTRSTIRKVKAPEGSVASNILTPSFNDEIIDFIDIDPVVERLTGSPLIPYLPKFNMDYVIERLVMGDDISKIPKDHITNLW